jgi:hypothetical protein
MTAEGIIAVLFAMALTELPTASYCEMYIAKQGGHPFVICSEGRPLDNTRLAYGPSNVGRTTLCRAIDMTCFTSVEGSVEE